MANVQAAIITIGDELLIGQTIDTNSAWMAQRLNESGIDVIKRIATGDHKAHILLAIDEAMATAEIVLLTGGLGPTADDITKPLLCEYFGSKLVTDQRVLAHVKQRFERLGLPLLERNILQAEVPDNCTVLFNKQGTAPGMLFEKNGKLLISMPGVPHEMMCVMEDGVMPELERRYISDALIHRTTVTAGMGESFVAEKIMDIENALPAHISLAYTVTLRMVKLRLTGRGANKAQLIHELEECQQTIVKRLKDIVVSLQDEPLEYIAGKALLQQQKKIGLAESCTGGYIAHKITQINGASHYFQGCIVCYQNEIKTQLLGVSAETLATTSSVSEATAIEMAAGARQVLAADIGFGITGLLSGGSTGVSAPEGTVWMAVTDGITTYTQHYQFIYDRERNKEIAVQMALLMIWKFTAGKC